MHVLNGGMDGGREGGREGEREGGSDVSVYSMCVWMCIIS